MKDLELSECSFDNARQEVRQRGRDKRSILNKDLHNVCFPQRKNKNHLKIFKLKKMVKIVIIMLEVAEVWK